MKNEAGDLRMNGELSEGDMLGGYRVTRPLGRGGMGRVYEAEHVKLGVRRALKVFSPDARHADELKARFLAEGARGGRIHRRPLPRDGPRALARRHAEVARGHAQGGR